MKYLNRYVPHSFLLVSFQFSLLFILCLYAFPVFAESHDALSYREKLERIIDAQGKQGFEGVFHYSRPHYKIETYIHQQVVGDGQVRQWIRKLGTEDGFLNVNGKIQCITKSYSDKFRVNSVLQSIKLSNLDSLLRDYNISGGDNLAIAGRKAGELILTSRDKDRYIYKLAYDKLTYFPLSFVFLDNKNNVLERGSFSEFKAVLSDDIHVNPLPNCIEVSYAPIDIEKKILWTVGIIPNGFSLIRVSNSPKLQNEQQVYSDGLVSFSVFIEPFVNDDMDGIKRNLGATVFVSHKLIDPTTKNKYLVTVVGEIPFSTAERVAGSVRVK